MAAGYSGTPLWKKLGYRPGLRVAVLNPPQGYDGWLGEDAPQVVPSAPAGAALVHLFVSDATNLGASLPALMAGIDRDGAIWVSWPKKASGVPTELTEDRIRAIALPLGLVDVKVCAVSEVWSGLKLVIRKELR